MPSNKDNGVTVALSIKPEDRSGELPSKKSVRTAVAIKKHSVAKRPTAPHPVAINRNISEKSIIGIITISEACWPALS